MINKIPLKALLGPLTDFYPYIISQLLDTRSPYSGELLKLFEVKKGHSSMKSLRANYSW
jgi:hypothetical protein